MESRVDEDEKKFRWKKKRESWVCEKIVERLAAVSINFSAQ